jgi:hypothetical protein
VIDQVGQHNPGLAEEMRRVGEGASGPLTGQVLKRPRGLR